MSTDSNLGRLKTAIAEQHPELVDIFSDAELLGMLQESREWCSPNCAHHEHVGDALRTAYLVATELALIVEIS